MARWVLLFLSFVSCAAERPSERARKSTDGPVRPADELGLVRGVVRESRSGKPVPHAQVRYATRRFDIRGNSGSDAHGRYELRELPLDTNVVFAYGPRHLPDRTRFREANHLFRDTREIERDLFVEPAVTVAGRVLNAAGDPVAGANVAVLEQTHTPRFAVPGSRDTAVSDAQGRFAVPGFYEGTLLEVTAKAPYGIAFDGRASAGAPILIRLRATCTVVGRFVDPQGDPVSKLSVSCIGEGFSRGKCDETGHFRLEHVWPGAYTLRVSRGAGKLRVQTFEARAGPLDLGTLKLPAPVPLGGVVVDRNGGPIAGATVRVDHQDTHTDAQGRFRLENTWGNPEVRASAEGWLPGAARRVPAGKLGVRLVLERALTLRGRVLGGGRPVAGAQVEIDGELAETAPDGTFRVTGLRGEGLEIVVTHPHFKRFLARNVAAWKGVRDFTLERGRVFSGTVVSEEGRPVAGLAIRVWTKGKQSFTVESDAQGRWSVGGLEEGPTFVDLDTLGWSLPAARKVPAGETTCELIATRVYEVMGQVLRADGRRPASFFLRIYRSDGTEVPLGMGDVMLDLSDSSFRGIELPKGRYTLVFTGPPHRDYGSVRLVIDVPCEELSVRFPK